MRLNEIGNIAEICWLEIPKHFPAANLDEYVVMPNHIHGIVSIKYKENVIVDGRCHDRDAINLVSTGGITGKHNPMLFAQRLHLLQIIGLFTHKVAGANGLPTAACRCPHSRTFGGSRFQNHTGKLLGVGLYQGF